MSTTYLSLPALAKATDNSESTLKKWRRDGFLKPYTYSGTRALYRIEDVEAAAIAARNARNTYLGLPAQQVSSVEEDRNTYKRIARSYSAKKGGHHAQLN